MTQIFNKEEDAMLPEPSEEQIKMWDEIEESLTEKRIENYANYSDLSDEFKKHFASLKTSQEIQIIIKKHQLPEESTKQLPYIIGMILLGETNIIDFVKTLQEKCKLAEEPARQLARDINQAIFLPVKESLKEIHNVPEWPRESEPTEPQLNGNVVDLKREDNNAIQSPTIY